MLCTPQIRFFSLAFVEIKLGFILSKYSFPLKMGLDVDPVMLKARAVMACIPEFPNGE